MAGNHKKGDVLGAASIAGIMTSNKAAKLIPSFPLLPPILVEIQLDAQHPHTGEHEELPGILRHPSDSHRCHC
jgi:cyclic pyranopterin phosphate synthase